MDQESPHGCLFCGQDAPIDAEGTCEVSVGPVHPSIETKLGGLTVLFRCHSTCVAAAADAAHRQLVNEATTK
jgi:hypothetical protein